MPDQIRVAVAITRPVVDGVEIQSHLQAMIAKYARAALYTHTAAQVEALRKQIVQAMAKQYLPYAQAIGKASAEPVLKALGGSELVAKGNKIRGAILQGLKQHHRGNLMAFRAELVREAGQLSGDVEVAFAKALRDGRAHKQLVTDLLTADRAEMKAIAEARKQVEAAAETLGKKEAALARAGKRTRPRRLRAVREARKKLGAAKRAARARESFLARFENRVQGAARDAVRREAQRAQTDTYRQAGYSAFTWISVNGSDSCPTCQSRHGETRTWAAWRGDGPGDGSTECGDSCQCQLVPDDYSAGNESLTAPVNPYS